jgi:hypothetical protein
LSKITFEETFSMFTRACFMEEKEPLKGNTACVLMGKVPKSGSAFMDLTVPSRRDC